MKILILCLLLSVCSCQHLDLLQPYLQNHGYLPQDSSIDDYNRIKRSINPNCPTVSNEDETNHIIVPPNVQQSNPSNLQVFPFRKLITDRYEKGHVVYIDTPFKQVSILHPGCADHIRETVEKQVWENASKVISTKERLSQRTIKENLNEKMNNSLRCDVAVNAGFFNTHSGQCYGNLISQGNYVVNFSSFRNAHFGILNNGSMFFGYLTQQLYQTLSFRELVGGVLWLLRNNETYVEESIKKECSSVEETGPLFYFANVTSARTALASDSQGRLMLVHVDGKTNTQGINLFEMAKLLKTDFGATNAINFDGGGSSTMVWKGSIINYPSDECPKKENTGFDYLCDRKVTSIICAVEDKKVSEMKELNYENEYQILLIALSIFTLTSLTLNFILLFYKKNKILKTSPYINDNKRRQYKIKSHNLNMLNNWQSEALLGGDGGGSDDGGNNNNPKDDFQLDEDGEVNGALLMSDDEISDFKSIPLQSLQTQSTSDK